ncbi:ABC transporter permease [Anaerosporobacter sp.]|uniref:ABC transporter permease n=1 Tax=Anaerosporobacter sp. TaxID=1872529 RepID=UPI00286F4EC0|nr:ABC transporter permease [Anaerosporobacter sp.]
MKQVSKGVAPILAVLVVFAIFLITQGVNPIEIYTSMITSSLTNSYGIGEVIIKSTPLILVAVATSISAKAGLVNVGGEGQLVIGALFATYTAVFFVGDMPSIIGLLCMALAGMLGGLCWSGIAAILRVKANMNETITTVIMNYIAYLVVSVAVYGKLKDPDAFSYPMSPKIADSLKLPTITGKVSIGIMIALVVAVGAWYVLKKTSIGYQLRVIGGNTQAAIHAGYKVKKVQFCAMLVSGAIAGLAGMIEISAVEGRLRTTTGTNYGYYGFLAAWMAWNNPLAAIITSLVIGFLSVAGNVLEINSGLPSASTQILMAMVLLAILWKGKGEKK